MPSHFVLQIVSKDDDLLSRVVNSARIACKDTVVVVWTAQTLLQHLSEIGLQSRLGEEACAKGTRVSRSRNKKQVGVVVNRTVFLYDLRKLLEARRIRLVYIPRQKRSLNQWIDPFNARKRKRSIALTNKTSWVTIRNQEREIR